MVLERKCTPRPYLRKLSHAHSGNQQAFWNDTFAADPAECENVWIRANQFINLDHMNGADGCELDEFMSHKFLGESARACHDCAQSADCLLTYLCVHRDPW